MMYKVTLKLENQWNKLEDPRWWVDGPIYILDNAGLERFAQTHQYFKVESATEEEVKWYTGRAQGIK